MNVDEAKGVPIYLKILAGGVLWFLPTPMGNSREFMYVCKILSKNNNWRIDFK